MIVLVVGVNILIPLHYLSLDFLNTLFKKRGGNTNISVLVYIIIIITIICPLSVYLHICVCTCIHMFSLKGKRTLSVCLLY